MCAIETPITPYIIPVFCEEIFMALKKKFASFDQMLANAPKPVLVDFYATWCGPCQMMSPILDQLGSHLREQLQVVKIDTDKYPALASQYGIQSLPTLVLFKQGLPVHRIEGVQQAAQLIQQLQGFL
jgi:thioredoxin